MAVADVVVDALRGASMPYVDALGAVEVLAGALGIRLTGADGSVG